jgi:hypothetical protein
VDNMKQCVDRHEVATGTLHFANAFLDFAEHTVCSPWPARLTGRGSWERSSAEWDA